MRSGSGGTKNPASRGWNGFSMSKTRTQEAAIPPLSMPDALDEVINAIVRLMPTNIVAHLGQAEDAT
jgi:hypothetical protein